MIINIIGLVKYCPWVCNETFVVTSRNGYLVFKEMYQDGIQSTHSIQTHAHLWIPTLENALREFATDSLNLNISHVVHQHVVHRLIAIALLITCNYQWSEGDERICRGIVLSCVTTTGGHNSIVVREQDFFQ